MKNPTLQRLGAVALLGSPIALAGEPHEKTTQLSELIGCEVNNSRTGDIVEIRDAVLDLQDGEIEYLVFSMDGKAFATSVSELECNRREDGEMRYVLNASPATSTGLNESSEQWPSTLDGSGDSFVQSYADEPDPEHPLKRADHVVRASNLFGCDVENSSGEDLGEIDDIVLTLDGETEPYGVLASGGVLGFGEDCYAIPLGSVRHGPEEDTLVMNASVSDFEQAKALDEPFPRDPRMAIEPAAQDVAKNRAKSGYDPNGRMEKDGWNDEKTANAREKSSSDDGREVAGIYVWRIYAVPSSSDRSLAQRVESRPASRITGEVVGMSKHHRDVESKHEGGREPDMWVSVDSKNGPTYDVLLAPEHVLTEEGFELSKGDVVTVDGVKLPWGGDMVFVANSVETGDKSIDLRRDDGTANWSDESSESTGE